LATRKAGPGGRDIRKEEYWRKTLRRWQEGGLTQAEFCRKEGLKVNTFSSWKHVLQARDLHVQWRPEKSQAAPDANPLVNHSFVAVDLTPDDFSSNNRARQSSAGDQPDRLVAEIVDASKGRSLRIFQGASADTVSVLISAFASSF
jgi:hypothetical protein